MVVLRFGLEVIAGLAGSMDGYEEDIRKKLGLGRQVLVDRVRWRFSAWNSMAS